MSRTLQPPGWDQPSGYANGIEARGRMVFVAGQIGWDAQRKLVPGGFVAQAAQALANVVAVLREAGARPEHVVRLTWYVTSRAEYLDSLKAIGAAYRAVMGRHFPVMAVVEVTALMEGSAKVEIETTAVV